MPQFVPPSEGPLVPSSNYVGASNGSLPKVNVVPGKAFDRIVQVGLIHTWRALIFRSHAIRSLQIWLENTDFASADSAVRISHLFVYSHPLTDSSVQPEFNVLAAQGIRLTQYCAVTHPSEPNYIASVGGDFFGMGDDNLYHIPPKCVPTTLVIQFLH